MPPIPDGPLEDGKTENDLESAKFTKDKETVDVVQPTAKLIGLTKEQLEQYRNDPFWKAIRYALFIAFWLVWLAMFVGAILIVIMSPKCVDVEWQNKMTVYKIFSLAYKDVDNKLDSNAGFGDFDGIKEKLGEIKQMGISVIWPTPILNYDKNKLSPEAIIDLEISTELGGQESFKELIKSAHTKDLKVLVDLPLTVASGNGNWVKQKEIKNGLLTPTGDATLLNLKNPEIQEPLLALARNFAKLGVDALNLADYGLLGRNSEDLINFANKINLDPELKNIHIYSEAEGIQNNGKINLIRPLFGNGEKKGFNSLLTKLNENIDSIDSKSKNNENNTNGNAEQIIWNIGNINAKGYRIDQLLTDISLPDQRRLISHLFSLVELFIPGSVSVLYGEELAALSGKTGNKNPNQIVYPWDNSSTYTKENQFFAVSQIVKNGDYESQIKDEHSPLKVFSKLAKLRQQSDFALGQLIHNSLATNLDLYLINRYPSGSSGHYSLIINWSGSGNSISLKELFNKINSKKFTILASTDKNFGEETQKLFDGGDEIAEQKVVFPAFTALILKSE